MGSGPSVFDCLLTIFKPAHSVEQIKTAYLESVNR